LVERRKLNRERELLAELTEWLQSCNSLGELYQMMAQFLGRLLPTCAGSLYIYANSRDVLESAKSWNGGEITAAMRPEDCWGLRRGRPYVYGESEISFPCADVAASMSDEYCCIPILAHGETIGLLHLEILPVRPVSRREPQKDGGRDAAAVRSCLCGADQLAIANVKLRDELRDQSIRDALTGLYNRRYMMETCSREFSRVKRAGQNVSIPSLDIDHFKKFNDNHGPRRRRHGSARCR
jgi:GAF domain-containing protein